MQHSLDAENVDAIAIDKRAATRAVVVIERVDIIGGVFEFPKLFAGLALAASESGRARFVVGIGVGVEMKEPATADGGRSVAEPEFGLPHHAQAVGGPRSEDAVFL